MTGPRHFMSNTPEYRSWAQMHVRCEWPKYHHHARYGGRGIRVCGRWASFINFYADMGPRPAGTSLDRIDNNGDYEPGNCRWATTAQQGNNRCTNRFVTYRGGEMTIAQAVHSAGDVVPRSTARGRIDRGWDVASAVETPADARFRQ